MAATPPSCKKARTGDADEFSFSEPCKQALKGGAFDARQWVTRPRRTGDNDLDEILNRRFRSMVKLLDILKQRADVVEAVQGFAEDRVLGFQPVGKLSKDKREETCWNSTYMTVMKIPKYWRAEWLTRLYSRAGFTEPAIKTIDAKDPSAVSWLFDFVTGIVPTTKVPREMIDKDVCDASFFKRSEALGRVTKEWFKRAVAPDGTVNAIAGGYYQLQKKRGRQGCDLVPPPGRGVSCIVSGLEGCGASGRRTATRNALIYTDFGNDILLVRSSMLGGKLVGFVQRPFV